MLLFQVQRFAVPLTDAQRRLARRAALDVRFSVESGNRTVAELVQRMVDAVDGEDLSHREALRVFRDPELFANQVLRRFERILELGRILVEEELPTTLRDRRVQPSPEFPPLPPARAETRDTFFDVRFVDETGQAINGLELEFDAGGDLHEVKTNPAGVALLEHIIATGATVGVPDVAQLEKILDARWKRFRPGVPPKEGNSVDIEFTGGEISGISLKPVVPHRVVVKPPLGRIFMELWDKTGRVRHAGVDYSIDGPMRLSGTTDQDGCLAHDSVFPGDYTLNFTLEFFEGDDKRSDTYTSPVVVLAPNDPIPERRMIGAVPRVVLARLRLLFNTNKAFLLPTMLPSIQKLRSIYLANNPNELLVVGHADTIAGSDYNDKLSLERAQATIAYLKDDVDAWLAFYDQSVTAKKRWGSPEDRQMFVAMADFDTKPKGEDAVRWFQRTRGLKVDGKAGPQTRRQLITEYMALDGASLEEMGLRISATAHGCGENFPLDETGEQLEPAPEDQKRDPTDRRVELFFFDAEFGIVPSPRGDNSQAGSPEYPEWRRRAEEVHDLEAEQLEGPEVIFVEIEDALFRTNSAVVLPEGERPTSDSAQHEAFTSIGIIATALRFNDEHPGKKILVAGHTDTTASVDFNQKLSEERARVALALLRGGNDQREIWKTTCDGRHTVSDYKQILSWVSRAFPDIVFDCDPGAIDDNESTGVEPVRRFQKAYNGNKQALGAGNQPDLAPDGDVGPLTWGAFFDCYEAALRDELGEDANGVAQLREKLVFVDDERKSLGFSEYFPVEELGVDNYRSQANRRAEILFYDEGEEPDVVAAENDPETTEIYLPGRYERRAIHYGGIAGSGEYVVLTDFRKAELEEGDFDVVLKLTPATGPRITRSARRDGEDNEGFVDIRFKNISTADIYTLVVQVGEEEEEVIFEDVPYEELSVRTEPQGELLAATDATQPEPAAPVATA